MPVTRAKKVVMDAGPPRRDKHPTRERRRPGAILVELSPEDRAKLLAVQAAYTAERGMPVAISWTVRLTIRAAWDRLTPKERADFTPVANPK